jgi:predicted SnoaL-like aldol condensation-catalyzing enzyme
MSAEENKALARVIEEEAFNRGHLAVADEELLAPDYVGHDPAISEEVRGPEGFKGYVGMIRAAFPDPRAEIEDQIAEGDRVASVTVRRHSRGGTDGHGAYR